MVDGPRSAASRSQPAGHRSPALVPTRPLPARLTAVALAVLWLTLIGSVTGASWLNDGHLIYTLDDPYIHLAMARNLALTGTYGVEPGHFSSASSSPLWTLLLALCFRLLPASLVELLPLILNLLAASAILLLFVRLITRLWPATTTRWQTTAALIGAAVLPLLLYLPGLVFIGLEHVLHLWLTLLFVHWLTDPAAGQSVAAAPPLRRLLPLAVVLPLIRLEGIILVGAAAAWLLLQRQRRPALALLAAGLLPLLLQALINLANGDLWLPNSVLAKTGVLPETGEAGLRYLARAIRIYLERWSANLGYDGGLLAVTGAALALLAWRAGQGRLDRRTSGLAGLFLITLLGHVALASVGWYERYQAYLIMLGSLAVLSLLGPGALTPRPLDRRLLAALIGLAVLLPALFHRQLYDQAFAWQASNNIYHQQYQMARFLQSAYATAPVALNDIGAVSYLRPGPLLDLYGLGSVEVLALRRAGRYDAPALDRLTTQRGVQVAIIYDSFFPVGAQGSVGSRPAHWRRVATWELGGFKITPSHRIITFYALGGEAEAQRLGQALRDFAPSLPRGVRVRYDS